MKQIRKSPNRIPHNFKKVFFIQGKKLMPRWQSIREFHQIAIQKRESAFNRMGHQHPVPLGRQDISGKKGDHFKPLGLA